MTNEIAAVPAPRQSLTTRTAERFGLDPARMLPTLKATAFKTGTAVSDEQMIALLIVAEQYHLNPFTRELFAFPDKGGIVPVVSVDGWARIINEHPELDGLEFEYSGEGAALACTAVMWRKDRAHPIRVTEYLAECKRSTQPWQSHPRRMLRHKALIQCARMAFGFAGIYDADEADGFATAPTRAEPASSSAQRVREVLKPVQAVNAETGEIEEARQVERQVETPEVISPEPTPDELLAEYRLFIERAKEAESAALVLDEARDVLPPEQHATLTDAFRARWQPTTPKE